MTYVYDDVTYVYDDVTYVYDDVTCLCMRNSRVPNRCPMCSPPSASREERREGGREGVVTPGGRGGREGERWRE